MKFIGSVFSFLIVTAFLFSVAIFIAGSLIFLNVQIYNIIYELYGIWPAFLVIILWTTLLSCIALILIYKMFCRIFCQKNQSDNDLSGYKNKIMLGFVAYELLKLYLKRRK